MSRPIRRILVAIESFDEGPALLRRAIDSLDGCPDGEVFAVVVVEPGPGAVEREAWARANLRRLNESVFEMEAASGHVCEFGRVWLHVEQGNREEQLGKVRRLVDADVVLRAGEEPPVSGVRSGLARDQQVEPRPMFAAVGA